MKSTSELSKKALLVNTQFKAWNTIKRDKEATSDVAYEKGIDSKSIAVVKNLFQGPALKEIKSIFSHARRKVHYFYTSPWMDDGTRIISSSLSLKYIDEMNKYIRQLEKPLQTLTNEFEDLVQRDRILLGPLFKIGDYPDNIRDKFKIKITMFPLPDIGDFRVDLPEQSIAKMKADMIETISTVENKLLIEMYGRLSEVVNNMITQLDKEDGKIFESLTQNIKKLTDIIPDMNITGNSELEAMRQEIAKKLVPWSAESLRNPRTRIAVSQDAKKIKDELQEKKDRMSDYF